VEFTFFGFEVKPGLLEGCQNGGDVLLVFFEGVGIDQGVVEVGGTESVQVLGYDILDKILEGRRGIHKTEGHN
jgi:hypothetical protein